MRNFSIDIVWAKIQIAITAVGGWLGYFVGGMVGHLSEAGYFTDCYNTGIVKGISQVGGNKNAATYVDNLTFYYTGEEGSPSSFIPGDVNNDGEVNIADINAVIDIILGGLADDATRLRADVNEDGGINIADINAIIDIISR